MKKTNRLTAMILALTMGAALASCGEKNEEAKGEIPTLKWYLPGTAQSDQETVNVKINEILEKEAGCHLDIEYLDAGVYQEKMQMLMASRDTYDLCFTGYVNNYQNAAQKGGLLKLDDYLDKYPGIKQTVPQYALDAARVDGSIYAIPNLQIMATATGLVIQKDLFDEFGQTKIEDVHGIEDIEPFMDWVVKNHPEKYAAKAALYGWNKKFDYKLLSEVTRGVDIIEKDGKIYAAKAPTLEMKKYLAQKNREYFEKGYFRQDIAVVTDTSADEKANKYACWVAVYKPGMEEEVKASKNIDVYGVKVSNSTLGSGTGRTTMTGVGKNSKYPEKALRVIELMNTNKELYNLVCFGIEETHYKMADAKHIEKIENSGYDPGMAWRFGNQFNALLLPGQDDDVWEQTEKFNNEAEVSPIIDFTFDNMKVRTEIAQIETVYGKYTAFQYGFLPLEDYYDTFMAELDKAGVQKVIDEVNRQLEEYFSKNK